MRPTMSGWYMIAMVLILVAINVYAFGWWAGALMLIAAKGAFLLGYFWPARTREDYSRNWDLTKWPEND